MEITFFEYVKQRVSWLRERGFNCSDELELWNIVNHPDYEKSASRWPHIRVAIDDVRRHIASPIERDRPRMLMASQYNQYLAWRAVQAREKREAVERGRAERRAARLARRERAQSDARAGASHAGDGAAALKLPSPFDP